jgi:hypothetical protein
MLRCLGVIGSLALPLRLIGNGSVFGEMMLAALCIFGRIGSTKSAGKTARRGIGTLAMLRVIDAR